MRLVIVTRQKEITVDLRDKRDAPAALMLCKTLGVIPVRWYATDEAAAEARADV